MLFRRSKQAATTTTEAARRLSVVRPFADIPDWFRATTSGRQAVEESRLEVQANRAATLERITSLRAEAGERALERDRLQVEGVQKLAALAMKLAQAKSKITVGVIAAQNATASLEREADRLERELALGADPSIDEFLSELFEHQDTYRHAFYRTMSPSPEVRALTNQWLDAVSQAIHDAMALTLAADPDPTDAIAAIRDRIPNVRELLEGVSAA